MTRHIIDKRHAAQTSRLLFRYARLERKDKPHPASQALQRRAQMRGAGGGRRLAYLRIDAGQIA